MNIEEPRYFSWIKVNEIAGCSYPKSNAELQWLKNQDIKHILCLSKVGSFFSFSQKVLKINMALLSGSLPEWSGDTWIPSPIDSHQRI